MLRVHAGKGLLAEDARIGALMEAIEYAVAEPDRHDSQIQQWSVADVAGDLAPDLEFVDLVPRIGLAITPDLMIPTVLCHDVTTGRTVRLPAELVFLPFDPEPSATLFGWSSNGLASGNSVDEATLHGLLEVLERDAMAMRRVRDDSLWIAPRDLPEPFASLAAEWRSIGIELAVRHLPNAFDLPCFAAYLHEAENSCVQLAGGSAMHLDRKTALTRAVCEAAQSRLSAIHGGREDMTAFHPDQLDANHADWRRHKRKLVASVFSRRRRIAFEATPQGAADRPSLKAVLDDLLQRLSERGFPSVFRHCFARDLDGLSVVKVIVPRCEELDHSHDRIGHRLLARLSNDA